MEHKLHCVIPDTRTTYNVNQLYRDNQDCYQGNIDFHMDLFFKRISWKLRFEILDGNRVFSSKNIISGNQS